MATTDGVLRRWLWPTMDSAETAKSYVNIGVSALVVYSIVSGTVIAITSTTPLAYTLGLIAFMLLVNLALAIFLYRGSRVAAVLNLAIQIGNVAMAGGPGHLDLLVTVLLIMFVNAVWAAFAYQRFLDSQRAHAIPVESGRMAKQHNSVREQEFGKEGSPVSGRYNKEELRRMAEMDAMVSEGEWEEIRKTREFKELKKEMQDELTKSLDERTFHTESLPPWWKTRSGFYGPWHHAPWRSRKVVNAVRIVMVVAGLLLAVLLWRALDYLAH